MKKITSVVLGCVFSLSMLFVGSSCAEEPSTTPENIWTTAYTEEEHIERIWVDTICVYYGQAMGGAYTVDKEDIEIVYSFDNLPKYFLVTVHYNQPIMQYETTEQPYETSVAHIIGGIKNDQYYYGITDLYYGFRAGPSPWHYLGYSNTKKYFGKHSFGVEQEGQIVQIYNSYRRYPIGYTPPPDEYGVSYNSAQDFTQKILTTEEKAEILAWTKKREYKHPFPTVIYPTGRGGIHLEKEDDH